VIGVIGLSLVSCSELSLAFFFLLFLPLFPFLSFLLFVLHTSFCIGTDCIKKPNSNRNITPRLRDLPSRCQSREWQLALIWSQQLWFANRALEQSKLVTQCSTWSLRPSIFAGILSDVSVVHDLNSRKTVWRFHPIKVLLNKPKTYLLIWFLFELN